MFNKVVKDVLRLLFTRIDNRLVQTLTYLLPFFLLEAQVNNRTLLSVCFDDSWYSSSTKSSKALKSASLRMAASVWRLGTRLQYHVTVKVKSGIRISRSIFLT